jgi:uncharacterized coiled-coil protein SlyX
LQSLQLKALLEELNIYVRGVKKEMSTMDNARAIYDKFVDGKHIIQEQMKNKDMVNHPPHYTNKKWEVIDVLEEFFPNDPLLFNVGKYIMRHEHKGQSLQDLEKAAWYLQRKINKLKDNHGRA